MTPEQQANFIERMYNDLFREADVSKVSEYCSADFVEENNYDILDYNAFVQHVDNLSEQSDKVSFEFDYLVNIPGKVVFRCIVNVDGRIAGAPPASLLISYWQFNDEGKVNYCKEVEYADT